MNIVVWEYEVRAGAYDVFLASDRARYAEFDAQSDALTTSERRLGRHETL